MTLPSYSIHTRELRGGPILEVYFRHRGRQVHRPIGPAWTKRGRAPEGYFHTYAAEHRAREIIREQRGDGRRAQRPDLPRRCPRLSAMARERPGARSRRRCATTAPRSASQTSRSSAGAPRRTGT
jgi:hypothetical protein